MGQTYERRQLKVEIVDDMSVNAARTLARLKTQSVEVQYSGRYSDFFWAWALTWLSMLQEALRG